MLSASFMTSGEATTYPPHLIPHAATLAQYRQMFVRLNIGRAFLSSAIVATLVTVCSLVFNSLAGYAFAKLRFRGRERLFGWLLMALIIPPQVGMLPLFLFLKQLHLVNTYWGVALPSLATVFGIFLIRQFMLAIPQELLEAARIDGASELRIYWSIVVPLARPILATLATFMFMSSWNDFMWPLIVLSDQSHYTLPVAVANLVGEHVQDVELMMAGSVITVVPVLVLFIFLQRYYIAGLMVGSVKG
jgi:multiple sugar transport system permease protein